MVHKPALHVNCMQRHCSAAPTHAWRVLARVPCRRRALCCVNKHCRNLVNQLGLGGDCLRFDVTAAKKDRTSKLLTQVGQLLRSAQPHSQQLSLLITRLPPHQQLSTVSCRLHPCWAGMRAGKVSMGCTRSR